MQHRPFHFYVASDLHYGVSAKGDRSSEALARYVVDHPVDGLILGGDIGSGPESLAACLSLFADFPGIKLAVPGNHDIWLTGWETDSSWELHETYLPDVFGQMGFHPLHLQPLAVPGHELAFVGSMGWYDYSFRDDIGVDLSAYQAKTPPWTYAPIWNDANYARFHLNDEALTGLLVERLQAQLEAVAEASQIVAMVHHVVDKKLLIHPRSMVPKRWRFANAFLGSARLGEVLRDDPRVSQVFCGHIHMERKLRWGQRMCTCIGGDYKQKQLILSTPHAILEKTMFQPT